MKISIIFTASLILFLALAPIGYSDTIIGKDGRELKGIVVEDYNDRLVFSTADGETAIAKNEIKELIYDDEEDNLMKMADLARDRQDFARALYYYDMVIKLNPRSQAARDGSVYVQEYLYRKEEDAKQADVKRQEEIEKYGSVRIEESIKADKDKELAARLKNELGIEIGQSGAFPYMRGVSKGSAAEAAGVRTGDAIVAIWGKLTGYMPIDEVVSYIVEKPAIETKLTVDRTIDALTEGASFSTELEGLTVSAVKDDSPAKNSGIRQNDIITAIDGKSTRYMPLKDALKIFRERAEDVKLTIRREFIIWRKD